MIRTGQIDQAPAERLFGSHHPKAGAYEEKLCQNLLPGKIPHFATPQLLFGQPLILKIDRIIRRHSNPVNDCSFNVHAIARLLPSHEIMLPNGYKVNGHPETLPNDKVNKRHGYAGSPPSP